MPKQTIGYRDIQYPLPLTDEDKQMVAELSQGFDGEVANPKDNINISNNHNTGVKNVPIQ